MINIYEFIDYRNYLNVWFEEKKRENPRYSYRMLSRLLKSKSPSFLKDVIKGSKNINDDQRDRLIHLLDLNEMQREYFINLVLLAQSNETEVQNTSMERISAIRRIEGATKIEGESYRYLSRWFCPVIREMSMHPDFRCNPEWISVRLTPPISVEEAKEALQILSDLDMLDIRSETDFTTKDGSLSTSLQVQGLAVNNYHQQMLHLAQESVMRFIEHERHILGVTVSINSSQIPELKKELNIMVARILDLCESSKQQKDQTIQVGLHMFPLSKVQQ
jgi:uncharacterized protein (TIGR02147 family)